MNHPFRISLTRVVVLIVNKGIYARCVLLSQPQRFVLNIMNSPSLLYPPQHQQMQLLSLDHHTSWVRLQDGADAFSKCCGRQPGLWPYTRQLHGLRLPRSISSWCQQWRQHGTLLNLTVRSAICKLVEPKLETTYANYRSLLLFCT